MTEFINKNLGHRKCSFFYRVREHVTTFGKDENNSKPFSHTEDFRGDSLHKSKEEAERYYQKREEGIESSSYHLPFESKENFVFGEHSAISITLSLVEYYTEEDYIEHPLKGEDLEECEYGLEIEAQLLNEETD